MDSLLRVENPLSLDSNNNPPGVTVCSENTCSSEATCNSGTTFSDNKSGTNGWSDSDTPIQETAVVEEGARRYSLRPRSLRRCEITERVPENGSVVNEQEESLPLLKNTARGSSKRRRQPQPLSRYRRRTANARERERMREINAAFETLRRALPLEADDAAQHAASDKVTKIATLRLAIRYIAELTRALGAVSAATPLRRHEQGPTVPVLPPVSSLLPLKAAALQGDDGSLPLCASLCLTPPPALDDLCVQPR